MKNLITVLILPLFVACSAFEGSGDRGASASKSGCATALEAGFAKSYQPFLVTNCASCHSSGGIGKGAFADPNVTLALEDFQLRGSRLIYDRAIDANHQAPFTGPQLQAEADRVEAQWQSASANWISCEEANPTIPEAEDEPIPESATYTTVAQNIDADDNIKTMSWDLETEIEMPAGTVRAGAEFLLDIQTNTSPTGNKSYLMVNPRLRAGGESMRVAYVEIYINGAFVSNASTFRGINRYVPASQERALSQTTMVVPFDFAEGDTLAMAFGILDPAPFNPTTFTALTTNVFAQNCNSCHSGATPAGGLDMTNYDGLFGQFMVTPYSTNSSEVYRRMIDVNNPMPPTGLLPQATQDSVRDWIRDGAPE